MKWTPKEVEILKQMKKDKRSDAEIAKHLGRGIRSVTGKISDINKKKKEKEPKHRAEWTKADEWTLKKMIGEGANYQKIAKRLKRTEKAVAARALSLGCGVESQDNLYTAHRIESDVLAGVRNSIILKWIKYGFIKTAKRNSSSRAVVQYDALLEFLDNPEYWFLWYPLQLKDRAMQLYYQELRNNHPWRWLSTREAARALGVKPKIVLKYCRNGVYPSAIRSIPVTHSPNGHWFIKSTDIGATI